MFVFLSILILLTAVLLVLVVLVQNSKGGGLAANFQSTNQIMGVRRTTDFLEKATWTLAAVLLFLSILSSIAISNGTEEEASKIQEKMEDVSAPAALPGFPEAPAQPEQPAE